MAKTVQTFERITYIEIPEGEEQDALEIEVILRDVGEGAGPQMYLDTLGRGEAEDEVEIGPVQALELADALTEGRLRKLVDAVLVGRQQDAMVAARDLMAGKAFSLTPPSRSDGLVSGADDL